jgi:hypothetical protein
VVRLSNHERNYDTVCGGEEKGEGALVIEQLVIDDYLELARLPQAGNLVIVTFIGRFICQSC